MKTKEGAMNIKKLAILAVLALMAGFMMPEDANAADCGDGVAPCACGDTVVADTTLGSNLNCTTTPGLIIGADNITVDLNGHTLTGATCASCHGIRNVDFDNVTIESGTIVGFEQGIRGENVDDFKIEGVSFSGQTSSHAIDILDSENVVIEDSSFSLGTSFLGPEAIRLESVDGAVVEDVDIAGGFVGVNFACGSCDDTELPTNGKVEDSVIADTFTGVLIANSTDAKIEGNEISDGMSVVCPAAFCGSDITIPARGIHISFLPNTGTKISENYIFDNDGIGIRVADVGVTDLEIEENDVRGNTSDGILLQDVDDSEVSENTVEDNDGRGIALETGSTGRCSPVNTLK